MILYRICVSLALIASGFLFGADQTVKKVRYYIVNLHGSGKNIFVPKSCFDKAIKTKYLAEGQHHTFGCRKKGSEYDIVSVQFNLIEGKNYGPGDNKQKYAVRDVLYTRKAMSFDKTQLKDKHQLLKFIEDNAQTQLENDLGPSVVVVPH